MRIELREDTVKRIKNFVKVYTEASGETISDEMVSLVIEMLIEKYASIKSFPADWENFEISDNVNDYFDNNSIKIALKIPEIIGRMGAEGETSHSENGVSSTFAHADPLYDAFPDVVQFAHVL